MTTLTLGLSPCPNDTFIFHALVSGIVRVPGVELVPYLADVETLNRRAIAGELDVTKVSYGAIPELLDRYVLLRSGGALGRGCGPLLVAKDERVANQLATARIAIPGRTTTANLLLSLYAPTASNRVEMEYSAILQAVADGEVDAGLIIHESRFTYPGYGLTELVDLGAWWESTTGRAIPLGAIVARRELGGLTAEIERGIRSSVEHAFTNPGASAEYVRMNAQEMESDVIERHIALYVNRFSVDLGAEGEEAVRALLQRGSAAGVFPGVVRDPFAPNSTTHQGSLRSGRAGD